MELPLSVNGLQKIFVRYFRENLTPVSITELCWQARSYVVLHHIKLTESSFLFSSGMLIHFSDVIAFSRQRGILVVVLKTGVVYLFSGDSSQSQCVQICNPELYAKTGRMLPKGRSVIRNLQLLRWKIKEYMAKDIF
jgi:hypothetical protein